MVDQKRHPALQRILDRPDNQIAFDTLITKLSGADLTTFLLGVFAERVASVTGAGLMRQYGSDRFVAPSSLDAVQLARVELVALEVASQRFETVAVAPTAPLGTHFAMGATPQNNVVSTVRMSEVTADPTNSLALEAAARRLRILGADPRSQEQVRLTAVHRVTRAQHFDGPRSFAHFSLGGLVTAGRDRGDYAFELESVAEQIQVLVHIVRTVASVPVEVRITAFNPQVTGACVELCEQLAGPDVACSVFAEREHGRGYYRNVCFKVYAVSNGELVELGDGGDVWWTRDLVQSRKERLMIGGLGIDRLAMVAANTSA